MRGTLYHLCYTSHNEVLCRTHLDYVRLYNSMVQAVMNTNSILVTYSIMSNHLHLAVITTDTRNLVQRIRSSYTQIFNDIYRRAGTLGDPGYFMLRLEGRLHVTTALSYILCNPVHHRVCANPFAYPYSPILMYFNKQNSGGLLSAEEGSVSLARSNRTIRRNNSFPAKVRFDVSGRIEGASIVSTDIFEGHFGSYRAFQYGIGRVDYGRREEEQIADNSDSEPVTISSIEPHLSSDEVRRIMTQNSSWVSEPSISDMELCSIIDGRYLERFHKMSYAQLTDSEKVKIARHIQGMRYVPARQLGRCLGIAPEMLL